MSLNTIFDYSSLPREQLISENVVDIAEYLIGKYVISTLTKSVTVGKIVETEAYRAPEDKASHAYNFRRTNRNEIMYGPAGTAYIYLCYGLHNLCNIVTGPPKTPHAVLIRAIEPIEGLVHMSERRKLPATDKLLTNGPGKWTQAMAITTKHNGIDLCANDSPIRIVEDTGKMKTEQIVKGARVGIAYAKEWAMMPWRFRIQNNKWTSKPNHVMYTKGDTDDFYI